jgi:DNA mismatch repair protein MSH4
MVICAIGEARGVSPSVGVALVNMTIGEAVLSQICDNQSYVKTVHKIQMASPSTIVFMSTACPPSKDSVLYTLIDELIPSADIEIMNRSAWSEADGLEYLETLAFDSDVDPMKVAIQGRYYCISSLAAVSMILNSHMTLHLLTHIPCHEVPREHLQHQICPQFLTYQVSTVRRYHDD